MDYFKGELEKYWNHALVHPWMEMENRPRKNFRGEMVHLGWSLAGESAKATPELLQSLSQIVETLHLGSLIIDDIEDSSTERRGRPSLHTIYGIPVALNVGNFLYFHAFKMVDDLPASTDFKNLAYREIASLLHLGHMGQALDVGTPIDQVPRALVPELVETSLRLKSGALMKLALRLGALATKNFPRLEELSHFGERFGVGLQKLDDVGNLRLDPGNSKRLEDLKLRRPTWIWSVLSVDYSEAQWNEFVKSLSALPDTAPLDTFLSNSGVRERAYQQACNELAASLGYLKESLNMAGTEACFLKAQQIVERLCHAYE